MLSRDDVHFIKDCIPFYIQLNMDEKDLLQKMMYQKIVAKGDKLSAEEGNCDGLILVKKGRIRAYIMSAEGKEITLFRLKEKESCILTASCLFKNFNFNVYFEVEKESIIYLIPTLVFEQLSHFNISVNSFILENMASRFSSAMWVMDQVIFGSLSKRVAICLLEQTVLENSQTLKITHEEIAKNIGSAREAVSRMLKYLENECIINTSRGAILIENIEKLKALTL